MKNKITNRFPALSTLIFLVGVAAFAFVQPTFSIIGKWSILNLDGTASQEYVVFYKDSTYEVALPNGQIGEKGYYLLRDSTFSIKNAKNICGKDYWGSYHLTFHGSDSIHLSLIRDTCSERRMDLVGYNPGLKRIVTK
jgi:hypothetical protein